MARKVMQSTTPKVLKTTKKTTKPEAVELQGSARHWLRENGYEDVCELIDQAMAFWAKKGIATRRSWWDILSGDRHGKARIVAGREFPVIAAAQERQGKTVTANALRRRKGE